MNDYIVKKCIYSSAVSACMFIHSTSESRQQMKVPALASNGQSGDGGSPALTPSTPAISPQKLPEDPVLKNLPPDFHPTAHKNLDACFGEAMQVLHNDRIIDPMPNGLEEVDRVARLSRVIMRWASGWGGVSYWPISLDHSFIHAKEEGCQDQWQEQLLSHASMGWRLLAQLGDMGGRLPKEPYKVKELWRLQVQLVEVLVMGITIINTRCSVLPHYWKVESLPPIPWSDESASELSEDPDAIGDADDEGNFEDFD